MNRNFPFYIKLVDHEEIGLKGEGSERLEDKEKKLLELENCCYTLIKSIHCRSLEHFPSVKSWFVDIHTHICDDKISLLTNMFVAGL